MRRKKRPIITGRLMNQKKNLSGRTLSTVALSSLEHQRHPSNISLTRGNTNAPAAPAGASYWDEAPIDKSLEGKRLSALDLSAMEKQHVDNLFRSHHHSGT